MGTPDGPIDRILTAYQNHASDSLGGPSCLGGSPSQIPNLDLYNYYVRFQRELMSSEASASKNEYSAPQDNRGHWNDEQIGTVNVKTNSERNESDDFAPESKGYVQYINSEQQRHIMNLYHYYEQYCQGLKYASALLPLCPNTDKKNSKGSQRFALNEDSCSTVHAQADHPYHYLAGLNPIHKSNLMANPVAPNFLGQPLFWPPFMGFNPQYGMYNSHSTQSTNLQPSHSGPFLDRKTPLRPTTEDNSSTLPPILFTNLEGYPVACFDIGGEKRLCLPQVLNVVLKRFTLRQINVACDRLHIYCSRCDGPQLATLKRARLISLAAMDCGLITKTDSERLCNSLLRAPTPFSSEYNVNSRKDEPSPSRENPATASESPPPPIGFQGGPGHGESLTFMVYHECFGRCTGRVNPDIYIAPDAACVECLECGLLLAPAQFVSHSHRPPERRVCHWGFDSERWRSYLLVPAPVSPENPECSIAIEEGRPLYPLPRALNDSNPIPDTTKKHRGNVIDLNEAKLKSFKEKFMDTQEYNPFRLELDAHNQCRSESLLRDASPSPIAPRHFNRLNAHVVRKTPGTMGQQGKARTAVDCKWGRPPPKKRTRYGANGPPFPYDQSSWASAEINAADFAGFRQTAQASVGSSFDGNQYQPPKPSHFLSESNICNRLTPLVSPSPTTIGSTPSLTSPINLIGKPFQTLFAPKSFDADDKMGSRSSLLNLSRDTPKKSFGPFASGQSGNSKRKRFLSVPEGIHFLAEGDVSYGDQAHLNEQTLNPKKTSCHDPHLNLIKGTISAPYQLDRDSLDEENGGKKRPINSDVQSIITSHFVDLSKDLMIELDTYARYVPRVTTETSCIDNLKTRLLGHLKLKHSSLQANLFKFSCSVPDNHVDGFAEDVPCKGLCLPSVNPKS